MTHSAAIARLPSASFVSRAEALGERELMRRKTPRMIVGANNIPSATERYGGMFVFSRPSV